MDRPKVGVGVIILNKEGKVLIGKRKGSHAPYYSIPGGHLENGETFEEAAIKEVEEETGLHIEHPEVISVTNNLKTYKEFHTHYISVILLVKDFVGEPKIMEPDKCESWGWYTPTNLPLPHFDASEMGIQCYLKNSFYLKDHS
ncbi:MULTISPECIES: nucleotide triphosphate diphosphatase NUDT15 [Flammeovirga]|uniref:NUDIX domain-containing protein n=1 Tax=Flammeovirga agarivorans TaxID=2726742 RepID=A0A7X8SJV1_9BACT|nr:MULTISPECIES: NUDIX hydrolase [Flammeovirga]NLR91590.1 NUDIX domain-containing protein [Flammeovirga agarivorans]